MTMDKSVLFWKTNPAWYHVNPETLRSEINEDAPKEAKASFERWKKNYYGD